MELPMSMGLVEEKRVDGKQPTALESAPSPDRGFTGILSRPFGGRGGRGMGWDV